MRRSDREITDTEAIDGIIRACDCCRVAIPADGAPYIVPLSFGTVFRDGQRVFYFHGARTGRKAALAAAAPEVGFELDTGHTLHLDELACECSVGFSSIIGTGKLSLVTDEPERLMGLQSIMAHLSGRDDWSFSPHMLSATAVFRLSVTELACKKHL